VPCLVAVVGWAGLHAGADWAAVATALPSHPPQDVAAVCASLADLVAPGVTEAAFMAEARSRVVGVADVKEEEEDADNCKG
jgi:hypothetical protein